MVLLIVHQPYLLAFSARFVQLPGKGSINNGFECIQIPYSVVLFQ